MEEQEYARKPLSPRAFKIWSAIGLAAYSGLLVEAVRIRKEINQHPTHETQSQTVTELKRALRPVQRLNVKSECKTNLLARCDPLQK